MYNYKSKIIKSDIFLIVILGRVKTKIIKENKQRGCYLNKAKNEIMKMRYLKKSDRDIMEVKPQPPLLFPMNTLQIVIGQFKFLQSD